MCYLEDFLSLANQEKETPAGLSMTGVKIKEACA
jgi:hypothetical protein